MKGMFENKELKIIGVETMDMRAYEPMFHSHGEIFYVSEGRISVNIDGNKRELTSGDMCVVFPYAIHSYEPIGKVKALYVLFSTESAGEFAETLLSWRAENPFLEKKENRVAMWVFLLCCIALMLLMALTAGRKSVLRDVAVVLLLVPLAGSMQYVHQQWREEEE